jgi:hypothetical protein
MTQKFIFLLLLLLSIGACKNPKMDNSTSSIPTSSLEMCMDTIVDNAQRWDYFTKGYRDTCYVNGQHFSIRLIDTVNAKLALEKKIKGVWSLIDSVDYDQDGYGFSTDYNNDGYQDFIENKKWQDNVFLYDAHNQTFVHTGEFYTGAKDSSICIDAAQNLYCDRWSYKFENGWSYLYTLKDLKRTNLAKMEYISQDTEGLLIENPKKRTVEVAKATTTNEYSKPLEIVKNTKGYEEFNYPYADYWKKNWQKFLIK